jgi:hypothetical protein
MVEGPHSDEMTIPVFVARGEQRPAGGGAHAQHFEVVAADEFTPDRPLKVQRHVLAAYPNEKSMRRRRLRCLADRTPVTRKQRRTKLGFVKNDSSQSES